MTRRKQVLIDSEKGDSPGPKPIQRPSILAGSKAGLGYYSRPRPAPIHALLDKALYPGDIYKDNVFWADLNPKDQRKFIAERRAIEVKATAKIEWENFKRDPLMPSIHYWQNYVMPGMGLFTEGYVLFSIGNLKPLFQAAFPTCWKTHETCDKTSVQLTDYLQVVGIIFGQFGTGALSDWISRKFGLVQDAALMTVGALMLTSSWGTSLQGWIACYAVAQFVYGCGVGGEYPMTATLSMERASGSTAGSHDRLLRGRKTVGAFLMQGWGQFVNQAMLIICLLIFNSHGGAPYSKGATQATYRVSFGFVSIFIVWLLYYRIWRMRTADQALKAAKSQRNVSGYDVESLNAAFKHYWHRILATSVGWFCNDFAFYSSKVFAGEFIGQLSPGGGIMTTWLWNLLFTGISLVGYYAAFCLIDSRSYGRRRMQMVGFAINFIIFTVVAFAYNTFMASRAGLHAFQFMYLFSGFWQQFGPNCVTFLVAAEVYPTAIRGSAHGFSAAIGKIGALVPLVMFSYIESSKTKFLITCWFHLLGLVVTYFFLPDVTCLDLREQERRWSCLLHNRAYHGTAVHPRHLSWYERNILKQGSQYDAHLDADKRIHEWSEIYESEKRSLAVEDSPAGQAVHRDESTLSPEAFEFFTRSAMSSGRILGQGNDDDSDAEGTALRLPPPAMDA